MPKDATISAEGLTAGESIAVARRVIGVEIDGLTAVIKGLDGGFAASVELIAGVQGRVIVTGMGKSGHIARKIAATFASTARAVQLG